MDVFSARSFWLPVLLTTLVAAFFGAVLARRGRHLERMLGNRDLLEVRLARVRAENARLRAQRDELLSSPEAVERVAREEYAFAAPGEKVSDFESTAPRLGVHLPGQATPSFGEKVLMWRHLSLLLPASVFVVTAIVFAVLNLISAAVGDRAR